MCGRYVLVLRPAEIRQRFEDAGLPVDDAPSEDGDAVRQSYNIAPAYIEPVYRLEAPSDATGTPTTATTATSSKPRHIIQPMKWGLIPSWHKHAPDYATLAKAINCRDDSLCEDHNMWSTIKHRKRCIVPAEGFYEWLNKGTQKVPHYTKRADGQLMFFAGLWDCVHFDSPAPKQQQSQTVYTYTIITTSSSTQLRFLHDRMPVILEPDQIKTWLDPSTTRWTAALQQLLKPFSGPLTVYPVAREVGKVGNNSPSFVMPVTERKDGIKSAFGRQKEVAIASSSKPMMTTTEETEERKVKGEEEGEGEGKVEEKVGEEEAKAGEKRGTDYFATATTTTTTTTPTAKEREEREVKSPLAKIPRIYKSSASNPTTPGRNLKSPKRKTGATAASGNKKITNFFTSQTN